MPSDHQTELSESLESQIGSSLSSLQRKEGMTKKGRLRVPRLASDADDVERKEALRSLLERLSSPIRRDALASEDIDEIAHFFDELYGGEPKYRHSYADICDVVFGLYERGEAELDEDGIPFGVTSLAENVNAVYERMRELSKVTSVSEQAKSVQKLCDHIELERTRLKHFAGQAQLISEYSAKSVELEERFESDRKELEAKFENDRTNLENEFKKQVNDMRVESIAILGVFSAVVLAFNGAVSFSDASISAVGTAAGMRVLVLIIALVAFALLNTITILMVFLWKMTSASQIRIGDWPGRCLVVANAVLIAVIAISIALGHPAVRQAVGLP